jgi:hypothetical protein
MRSLCGAGKSPFPAPAPSASLRSSWVFGYQSFFLIFVCNFCKDTKNNLISKKNWKIFLEDLLLALKVWIETLNTILL